MLTIGRKERDPERMQELVKEMDNIRDNWMLPDDVAGTDELSMSWCMHMYDGDRTIKRVSPQ
jgi:hypothetical protein